MCSVLASGSTVVVFFPARIRTARRPRLVRIDPTVPQAMLTPSWPRIVVI
jgi:hypothetical protein